MKRLVMDLAAGILLPLSAIAQQSALEPGGSNSRRIEWLGVFFVVVLGVIFLMVMGVLLTALLRRHRGIEQEPLELRHIPSDATEHKLASAVGWATAVTVVILLVFIVTSVLVGKATAAVANRQYALTVEITGNQWWWNIRYVNQDPSRILVTANELHIPVGKPVLIRGMSNDVIHSFWAPGLQGKRDLIPGHVTTEWIEADRPGRFRGQCAEFCGLQHAHMALWVVADEPQDFEAWFDQQLQPAAAPGDPTLMRGQSVFLNSSCVLCHGIQGTPAAATNGPDLTHFGSRFTLAAGTLANNKGNLAGWIADPQNIKPGNHMATVPLKPEDMQPLIEYLESLQ